jgi:capsular polysaccharide biosynthesis protein
VLLPAAKLQALIERRNLYPLRRVAGMPFALQQLREELDIKIWKNTFAYYDEGNERTEHSARIGLTVTSGDPGSALELARDLAAIVIETSQEQRRQLNATLAREIAAKRDALEDKVAELSRSAVEKQAALVAAKDKHDVGKAQTLSLQLVEIDSEQKRAEKSLTDIAHSSDALADRIAAAGLDYNFAIVEENRPERPLHRDFVIALVGVIVGIGSLLGAAMVVGVFDSRIHDGDDVSRLGLPVLGHVPGFAGDQVGSLAARGVPRARVPSFLRWRSSR